jgi:response regulator RpfG family c-di-GMP phosphodiesterase
MSKKLEVLCVDDEPQILEGLQLHLKRHFIVNVASSGADGLALLAEKKDVAVILSDMRMPNMDGAKFLNAARTAAPDAVRMLLTGYTDMQSAIAAVNEGQIFRFISKPCPPDQLLQAFGSAVQQHRLIVAEKVLLQQTLLGCVDSLAKVLSLSKPAAFGRALRLRGKVHAILEHLHWQEQWQCEAAAVLSQLGAVTLAEETLMKLNEGEALEPAERLEVAVSIEAAMEMLKDIPRLEPVLEILKHMVDSLRDRRASAEIALGGRLLDIVFEWDALEAQGYGQAAALDKMSAVEGVYDAAIMSAAKSMIANSAARSSVAGVALRELAPGMVLAQDLVRKNGVVILPRGFEIDGGLLDHIRTFAGEFNDEPIRVATRAS